MTLVDRRHAAGGHWQDAYSFVQLHQASQFYGVASTVLGTGAIQSAGPEAGLHERARRAEIQDYYDHVLHDRLIGSGRVTFLGGSVHHEDAGTPYVTSLVSGETVQIDVQRRVVDATYLSPTIPATTPAPFGVAQGTRVVAVNELGDLADAPKRFVIVGSGKTASDAIVWLLTGGVPSDRITWVRPRDPWMLNRAVVQPDPVTALGLAESIFGGATEAASIDDLFLRLEAAGVMLRVDTRVLPTMAKAPTIGGWEIDLLRSIEHVVRLGHVERVTPDTMTLTGGDVRLAPGSLVVHCAADGLRRPALRPLWDRDRIRLQTVRAGFPCFGAALTGYVEATRDDDSERNRLCPPNAYGNSPADWLRMQARGAAAVRTFMAEPDIAAWSNGCALNFSRVPAEQRATAEVQAAAARLSAVADHGLAQLTALVDGESGSEPVSPSA